MGNSEPAVVPAWKSRLFYVLASWTPLRWRFVRERAFAAQHWVLRWDRRRRERRGDWSRSMPALAGMDVRLGELLGSGGTFLEAGGNDGYTQSNTYYLEKALGWTGALVEPIPSLARVAEVNRPEARVVCAALTEPAQSGVPVRMRFGGLMSIVAGARGDDGADGDWVARSSTRGEAGSYVVDATGITLSEVIDLLHLEDIDLLSLDLEGYEPTALAGLDLDRHAPRWLLIEAHDEDARASVEAHLGERYERVGRFSAMDELYRRADVPAA
jgi:hypothetical protein